ncbi:MAG TPA: sigma 54-interacting transcriptional regulator, partial [Burkholderiales bacterium]|nr:sigma 54-interacting transcriptional regulator [Burkholderiales bacterium]
MQDQPALPSDGDSILKLAARSMFDLFSSMAEGMMLVDRTGRVVWINEGYKRFLPALGFAREEDFVGRSVAEVVPNTQMHYVLETGKPILIDLLTNRAGTFVVSRIPLRDDSGEVIGVLGMVLFDHPETTLKPLIAKFAHLQRDLDDARRALAEQRRAKYTFASFIGSSPAALEVKRQARRAAQGEATVLLLGETGTGKELLAHAIHAGSSRAHKPFVGVNLAALPETLMEAEFFGVAPGAYTGADRRGRDGRFKLADGGTLFLDEIGDTPPALQAKLLRALQEQEIEPLGSNRMFKVNVRVIAATSRDLRQMVKDGTFREDLYYRLNVLPIQLPPLRERLSDLEALAESLLEDIASRSGMPTRTLTPSGLASLTAHNWPGNVRELRNTLEQAAMLTDHARLAAEDFSTMSKSAPSIPSIPPAKPLPQLIAELERASIQSALEATKGNKVSAAKLLGISR